MTAPHPGATPSSASAARASRAARRSRPRPTPSASLPAKAPPCAWNLARLAAAQQQQQLGLPADVPVQRPRLPRAWLAHAALRIERGLEALLQRPAALALRQLEH